LDHLYPQVPRNFIADKTKSGIELSLGVLKAKLETETTDDTTSDFARLRSIINYLLNQGELGLPSDSTPYFYGTLYAHSLV
jgi:Family of unknown function (DUF7019)